MINRKDKNYRATVAEFVCRVLFVQTGLESGRSTGLRLPDAMVRRTIDCVVSQTITMRLSFERESNVNEVNVVFESVTHPGIERGTF